MIRAGKSKVETLLQGMLLLDKAAGPSSNRALQEVRRLLGGLKAGHAGTLDPNAEGLLLIGLGEGTKLIPFLGMLHKEYIGEMRFGSATDTHDAWGDTVRRAPVEHLSGEMIERQMKRYTGCFSQVPPMFSAVKVGGERLYRKARRGEEVERPHRRVEVMEFSLRGWEAPVLQFLVRCGSGTYIRTLCHDLAESCNSAGHMTALRRSAVGPFRVEGARTVQGLAAGLSDTEDGIPLIPLAAGLPHLPVIPVEAEESRRVRQGMAATPPSADLARDLYAGQEVRLVGPGGDLVAVVTYSGTSRPMAIRRVFRHVAGGNVRPPRKP